MKPACLLFLLILLSRHTIAQDHADRDSTRLGTIELNNGQDLVGHVLYNTYTNRLILQERQDNEAYYPASQVSSFNFYDITRERRRTFVTIYFKYPAESEEEKTAQFFEILRRYPDFTVMLRTFPMQMKGKVRPGAGNPYAETKAKMAYEQLELLCFFARDKEVYPFVEYTTREVDDVGGTMLRLKNNNNSRSRSKVLDKKLLKDILGNKYEDAVSVADAKNLSLHDRDELLLVLDSVFGN